MGMISCGHGHFYNDQEHAACPFCGVAVPLGPTRPVAELQPIVDRKPRPGDQTRATDFGPRPDPRDSEETRHVWAQQLGGIDPVVGWLVCVAGPDRGRDFRIHAERNFIGRGPAMDIAISGDRHISRENHAVISYNPKQHSFRLAPGEGRGLIYLNDDEVTAACLLAPYDRIELGETQLLFIPFCGERFAWSPEQNRG